MPEKKEITIEDLNKMKLHESLPLGGGNYTVFKVPGGLFYRDWDYEKQDLSPGGFFIPDSNRTEQKRKVVFTDHLDSKNTGEQEGLFHQFGSNYEEHNPGIGNYSTAIIEMENGDVKNIPVEDIRFIK